MGELFNTKGTCEDIKTCAAVLIAFSQSKFPIEDIFLT